MDLWNRFAKVVALLAWPLGVAAQTVTLSPAALSEIPRGATAGNPYWQHLVIGLEAEPASGDSIAIDLPAGVEIADVDADGQVDDEVLVESGRGADTGYGTGEGTTAGRIVLTSAGGAAGEVHVQFPIATQKNPAVATLFYGRIDFANAGETDVPPGGLRLGYIRPDELKVVEFAPLFADGRADTVTNEQGDFFPTSPRPATLPLPDLKGVSGRGDVVYSFWFSDDDSLGKIDAFTAVPALDARTGEQVRVGESSMTPASFVVGNLGSGTYYLYATSSLTGGLPLGRSRGIRLRHQPRVISVGDFMSGDADYLDSGLYLNFDDGSLFDVDLHPASAGPTDEVDVSFEVVDYDDNATVRLFYSRLDSLKAEDIETDGNSIEKLNGAVALTDSVFKENSDSRFTWKIGAGSRFIPEGNYYIYAAATDGSYKALGRSAHTYNVRHSPYLEIRDVDGFDEESGVLNTGGDDPGRYLTIRWNKDDVNGDIARADTHATIDLYYSAKGDFIIPGSGADLVRAAADPGMDSLDTHLIVEGLGERVDGIEADQFVWDLWAYANPDDGGVPAADSTYYIYAVVNGAAVKRLVRWGGTVAFAHDPYLRVTGPLAETGEDLRVTWEAHDVDDRARLWIVLTAAEAGEALGDSVTYGDITGDAASDWIGNSGDGSLAGGKSLYAGEVSEFSVAPSFLTVDRAGGGSPIADGSYAVYVVIDEEGGDEPAATSRAFRAPAAMNLSGLDAERTAGVDSTAVIEVVPGDFTIGETDTVTLEIRPSAFREADQIDTVDLVSVAMTLNSDRFRVIDQDATLPGIQPFRINPLFSGEDLSDTLRVSTVSSDSILVEGIRRDTLNLVYLEREGTTLLNGATTLATLQLQALSYFSADISTQLVIKNLPGRPTALYFHEDTVSVVQDSLVIGATIKPRSTIAGRVPLEGRQGDSTWVTFFLREHNSLTYVEDALFTASNDSIPELPGIQVPSLDSLGSFSLRNVPTGAFRLTAHVDSYLDGQYPRLHVGLGNDCAGVDSLGFNVVPLEDCSGILPTFLREGGENPGELLGGDIAGYTDSLGRIVPDNEIDSQDIDFVVNAFGRRFTEENYPANYIENFADRHPDLLADIDGDSLVWVQDLHMVTAHFGEVGKAPVYKRAASEAVEGSPFIRLEIERADGDGTVQVAVHGEGLGQVQAYGYRLRYERSKMRLIEGDRGNLFAGESAVFAWRADAGEVVSGGALLGGQYGVKGDGSIGRFRMEMAPGTALDQADVWIDDLELVDGNGRSLPHRTEGGVPLRFWLAPNFPNPFNAETMIRFALPQAGVVRLEIFDVAGQKVRTLASQRFAAGLHSSIWNGLDEAGREVGSGTYLLRIECRDFVDTRKMLLLR